MSDLLRVVSLLLVALALALAAPAQRVAVGVRGGFAAAGSTEIAGVDGRSVPGYEFGLPVEVRLTDRLAVATGVNFLVKGGRASPTVSPDRVVDVVARARYLELPVLGQVNFRAGAVRIAVMLGPALGYALSGEVTLEGLGASVEREVDFEAEGLSHWELSASAGVRVAVGAGPGELIVDAGLRRGLTGADAASLTGGEGKAYSRNASLTVGYLLPLGRRAE